jgi:hypothetical protein
LCLLDHVRGMQPHEWVENIHTPYINITIYLRMLEEELVREEIEAQKQQAKKKETVNKISSKKIPEKNEDK